jgi:hypothetical protein
MTTIDIIAQQETTTNEDGQATGLRSPKIYGVLLQKMCQCYCHIHPILLIEHYQTPKVNFVIYSLRMWSVRNLLQLMHSTRSPWHLPKL